MAGASVTMVASVLLQKGIHHACSILSDLRRWLEEHEYDSVRQMCGSMSRRSVPDPSALDRKSTRLNSSHGYISYAVFCLKKKNILPYIEMYTSITASPPIYSVVTFIALYHDPIYFSCLCHFQSASVLNTLPID